MFCGNCGNQVNDQAKVCPFCGAGLKNYMGQQENAEYKKPGVGSNLENRIVPPNGIGSQGQAIPPNNARPEKEKDSVSIALIAALAAVLVILAGVIVALVSHVKENKSQAPQDDPVPVETMDSSLQMQQESEFTEDIEETVSAEEDANAVSGQFAYTSEEVTLYSDYGIVIKTNLANAYLNEENKIAIPIQISSEASVQTYVKASEVLIDGEKVDADMDIMVMNDGSFWDCELVVADDGIDIASVSSMEFNMDICSVSPYARLHTTMVEITGMDTETPMVEAASTQEDASVHMDLFAGEYAEHEYQSVGDDEHGYMNLVGTDWEVNVEDGFEEANLISYTTGSEYVCIRVQDLSEIERERSDIQQEITMNIESIADSFEEELEVVKRFTTEDDNMFAENYYCKYVNGYQFYTVMFYDYGSNQFIYLSFESSELDDAEFEELVNTGLYSYAGYYGSFTPGYVAILE